MKIGVSMFVTDYSIGPGELAQAAEERGFEVAVDARAHAHSRQPQVALGRRPRAARVLHETSIRSWR